MSDLSLFLGRLLRRPHEIGALAPSSETLARAMAQQVPLDRDGPVAELGSGTGKITRALLDHGVAPRDLHAFEMNSDFALHLHKNFPDIHVHNAPAQTMGALGLRNVRTVVSGLPLLSMSVQLQEAILQASFDALHPDGVFVQFTYGPKPSIAPALRAQFGLSWTQSRWIWGNLPPARVYCFRRRAY